MGHVGLVSISFLELLIGRNSNGQYDSLSRQQASRRFDRGCIGLSVVVVTAAAAKCQQTARLVGLCRDQWWIAVSSVHTSLQALASEVSLGTQPEATAADAQKYADHNGRVSTGPSVPDSDTVCVVTRAATLPLPRARSCETAGTNRPPTATAVDRRERRGERPAQDPLHPFARQRGIANGRHAMREELERTAGRVQLVFAHARCDEATQPQDREAAAHRTDRAELARTGKRSEEL